MKDGIRKSGFSRTLRFQQTPVCLHRCVSLFLVWDIVMKILVDDCSLPWGKQRHESLVFLSVNCTDTTIRSSTIEKEAFVIMETTETMQCLLASDRGFDLYNDHNNLVFMFDPKSVIADISQRTLQKVLRWAVRLSA